MKNADAIVVLRSKLLSEELAEQVRCIEQWARVADTTAPDWRAPEKVGKHRG